MPEETPPKVDPNRAIKMEKLKQLQKVVQNLVQLRRLQLYKKVHEAKNPSACSWSNLDEFVRASLSLPHVYLSAMPF